MRGCVLYGAILIGLVLLGGQYLLPGSVVVWFAGEQATMQVWRLTITCALLVLALVHTYFHNAYLKLLYAMAAIGLGWSGSMYFLNNAAYVFDALLMLSASIAFGIHALLPADEPSRMPWMALRAGLERLIVHPDAAGIADEQLASRHYISEVEMLGHRLTVHAKNHVL